MILSQEKDGEIFQKPSDIANLWPLLIELLLKGVTKIGDGWKELQKIFKMSPIWHF